MAIIAILHVGEDDCQRIPVMQTAGFVVFRSECSILAIHTAFDREEDYSAVVFHNDVAALSEEAVHEARNLSQAPLVLFENPAISCDESEFDLVIPALTPPQIWLEKLGGLIQARREFGSRSVRLGDDFAAARSISRALRPSSVRNRVAPPIDPGALLGRDKAAGLSESKPPQELRLPGKHEKAG